MRTLYHEFESLEHLLATRRLPGGENEPIRLVVFGGTGAVGGAAVLELCQLILMSKRYRETPFRGEIYATGSTDKEISKFASRLYLALGETVPLEKVEPLRHYRLDHRIDLRFSLLRLEIPQDLEQRVEVLDDPEAIEGTLTAAFGELQCPFLQFTEAIEPLLHAVVVAIPLPSVATYTLSTIDRLALRHQLDHRVNQRIKTTYLRTFIRGLAVIQQQHARHVVIAHTTAVGGMYRVDGGAPEIRLGFAHSALGKKLVDKKYFADELTQLYIDHGFDVLITAAGIGIDAVEYNCHLPQDRTVRAALTAKAAESETPPVSLEDAKSDTILLFQSVDIPFHAGGTPEAEEDPESLHFGEGKEWTVAAAIRSGENGLFSVANCVALYNVMKVAIPEELAVVLVRHAVFGPERRHDWFQDKVSYYGETGNALFALKLLENYPEMSRAHLGAFAVQAYQALGSATHQARLHQLGIVMLILRLLDLRPKVAKLSDEALNQGLVDLDRFFRHHTHLPSFDDLEAIDAERLASLCGRLCEVDSMESAGFLLGDDVRTHGVRNPVQEKFYHRVATRIRRHLQTITSLGIPILYTSPQGEDRMLVGPYLAPLELALQTTRDLEHHWRKMAEVHGTSYEQIRDWTIVNNGFVDLRHHALVSSAQEPGPHLEHQVKRLQSAGELRTWLDSLEAGSYFTTGGILALKHRLSHLFSQIRKRKIELGTRETWKHLFPQDPEGRYILSPGLVETVRMYTEGLGKVTGTESLWPPWGY